MIKSILYITTLLLAAGHINAQNVTVKGGNIGSDFAFDCPPNTFITQIKGRSGKNIDSVNILCSDGSESGPLGGTGGKDFSLPANAAGYKIVTAYTGDKVDALQYQDMKVGGGGGSGFVFSDPGNCPAIGVKGRQGSRIDAIGFKFLCLASPFTGGTPLPAINATSFKGGKGGEPFNFACPKGTFINQISGRAGKNIDQIMVTCSDGFKSAPIGGSGGSPFQLPMIKDGYKLVTVYSADKVDALQTGDMKVGGGGGSGFTFTDPNNCPAVAVGGRAGDRVDALAFTFSCNGWVAGSGTVNTNSGSNLENGVPGMMYGGNAGNFYTYTCPNNAYVTKMDGRSVSRAQPGSVPVTVINQIRVFCSDGSVSPQYGSFDGQSFTGPAVDGGIREIIAKTSQYVNNIMYFAQQFGGDAGTRRTLFKDANNCPVVGMDIKSDSNVNAISFRFKCASSTPNYVPMPKPVLPIVGMWPIDQIPTNMNQCNVCGDQSITVTATTQVTVVATCLRRANPNTFSNPANAFAVASVLVQHQPQSAEATAILNTLVNGCTESTVSPAAQTIANQLSQSRVYATLAQNTATFSQVCQNANIVIGTAIMNSVDAIMAAAESAADAAVDSAKMITINQCNCRPRMYPQSNVYKS